MKRDAVSSVANRTTNVWKAINWRSWPIPNGVLEIPVATGITVMPTDWDNIIDEFQVK